MPLAALILAALTLPAAHAQAWPDVSRPPAESRDGAKDAALVIAIEDYAFAQDIPGAALNGRDWVTWLSQGRGVPLVKSLFNHKASREGILAEAVKVAGQVQPGGRLWLVYIGHGAPSESGDDGLLVGVDAQQTPQSLSARGLPRAQLLQAVEKVLPAGAEVVLVQDACFSGKTSRGDLAPGMAPLKVVSAALGAKVTVLSGARSDEYAGPLPDGTRPAFSYLVLGALRGWGDSDPNGVVTAEEAVRYANRAMVQTVTGRSQTAELAGADLPLGSSGRERGPDLTALSMVASGPASGATLGPAALGEVRVDLGGQATDFAALAAAAEALDAAAQQALAQKAVADAALAKERRRRLDAAAAEVRAAATRDYAVIAPLVAAPTANGKRVLEAWLARYGEAKVTIDGVVESVAVAEVAKVREALGRVAPAPTTGSDGSSVAARRVPAGKYWVGCTAGQVGCERNELPLHPVKLTRSVLVMETEVTQGLWQSVMGSNPAHFSGCGAECPVENVSWGDAALFANALSAQDGLEPCYRLAGDGVSWPKGAACVGWRLPTEAEWEVAARGGVDSLYAGGGELAAVAWTRQNSGGATHPVRQKAANGYGLYDMSGNVWEWVWDWYGPYSGSQVDPDGPPSGSGCVFRGGSWNNDAGYARISYRGSSSPDRRSNLIGLRLVRTAP
jgi:sulfatase modifying factor 1